MDRVTEIISPFTGVEFVPQHYLNAAADRGTRVHQYIESYFDPIGLPCMEEDIEGYLTSFQWFLSDHSHLFDANHKIIENRFYDYEKQITGQADLLIFDENNLTIFDWKTSSKAQEKSWSLQAAAYRHLCELEFPNHQVSVVFVHLKKTGAKPKLFKFENHLENLDIFFKCLELYRYFDMAKTRRTYGN